MMIFSNYAKIIGLIIVLSLKCVLSLNAQRTFQIMDSNDGQPVSFVSIVTTSGKGFYSDENGFFSFHCNDSDTIALSRVGYKSIKKSCKNLSDTILMISDNLLQEVVVSSKQKKRQTQWIGYGNNKSEGHFSNMNQAGLLLENPTGNAQQIVKLRFNFSKYRFSPDVKGRLKNLAILVRLRIYKVGNSDYPSEEDLLKENMVLTLKRNQTTLDFNIDSYNVFMPSNGVFIALEFIGFDTEDKKFKSYNDLKYSQAQQFTLSFSEGNHKAQSWTKQTNNSKWKKIIRPGSAQVNFNFGAEIETN